MYVYNSETMEQREPIEFPDDIRSFQSIKSEENPNDAISNVSFIEASEQELSDLVTHLKVIFYCLISNINVQIFNL